MSCHIILPCIMSCHVMISYNSQIKSEHDLKGCSRPDSKMISPSQVHSVCHDVWKKSETHICHDAWKKVKHTYAMMLGKKWNTHMPWCLEKKWNKHILPNDSLMVIYHGTIRKKQHQTNKSRIIEENRQNRPSTLFQSANQPKKHGGHIISSPTCNGI